MNEIKKLLNILFPFAATILLWRMVVPVLNPAGILAIVPIMYYSFIRTRPEFLPMAILGCFLLDYNFGTMFFWTSLFCIAYAINYLQTATRPIIEIADGQLVFACFIGLSLFMLGIWVFSWVAIGTAIWMFIITNIFYFAWTKLGDNGR